MKEFIKKNELWIFLVFGPIINVIFVYARSLELVPKYLYNNGRFTVLLIFLIFLVKYTRGNEGVKDIFKPMFKWNVNIKWYIFSLIFAFVVGAITLFLKGIYSGVGYATYFHPDFTVMTFRGVVALFVWAFLGEVVWVSYCIRELSKIIKPFYASQIIGFVWTLWWIPIILRGEGVLPGIPILSLGIFMLGIAGMCTVVYRYTKSGICVLILQFALNLTLNGLSISPSTGGVETFTAFAILYFITMLGFMYFMSPIKKVKIIEPAQESI